MKGRRISRKLEGKKSGGWGVRGCKERVPETPHRREGRGVREAEWSRRT